MLYTFFFSGGNPPTIVCIATIYTSYMHTMVEIERRLTQVINGQKNHSKTRAAMTPKDKTPATTPTTVTVSTYNNNGV